MRSAPSIVPADRFDRDIYLVLEDFGARAGCAWRETDEAETDLETILRNLPSGQSPIQFGLCPSIPSRGGREMRLPTSPTHWPSAHLTLTLRSLLHCKPSSSPTPQGASTCS
ncbi:hypothetical protein BJS_03387 [Bradyrhizobium japonicum SEMIA 5079]|nr:hypothetical protein BJS_03387 [Bradyrhizobium japonicum SEMIA 5079]